MLVKKVTMVTSIMVNSSKESDHGNVINGKF
jgi:hypothetical protein